VDDSDDQLAARFEDAPQLSYRAGHIVYVLQRHERDSEVDCFVFKRQIRGVGLDELELGAEGSRGRNHFRRRIDPDDSVSLRGEVTADPTLSAAEVQCPATCWRHELEESIPMKSPVAVVTRFACPANPVLRVALPRLSQHRDKVCPSRELG
jgi:hypothetical protein